jgi:hypothetical protein
MTTQLNGERERESGCSRTLDGRTHLVIIVDHEIHWSGRKIFLSVSLGLSDGRREAVEAGIKCVGVWLWDIEEHGKIVGIDILITRYRHGVAYLKVCAVFSFFFLFFSLLFSLLFCNIVVRVANASFSFSGG